MRLTRLLAAPALYLALALWLCWPLLAHPAARLSPGGTGSDEALTQWFLAHTAHVLAHGGDPFVSDHLGVPDGVNLAAQASMVGLGVPLAPVTLIFGAPVALAVLIVASLTLTACAWYWLLASKLRLHWAGAAAAGLLVGFNPQELAEATGRNHVAMQALIPMIIWRALRLASPQHTIREPIALGLLIAWQALIGEEVLLLTAAGLAVFCAAWLALRPVDVRLVAAYVRGLAIAAALALVLLAYPLWRQFAGPGHLHNFAGYDIYRASPAAYLSVPARWAVELPARDAWWAVPPQYTIIGLPITLLAIAAVIALRRRPLVAACAAVALVFAVASLGVRIQLGPVRSVPGPWRVFAHRPVLDAVLASRMILVVIAALAVIGAHALHAVLGRSPGRWRLLDLGAGGLLLAVAAAQLAPHPYTVWRPTPVPAFITSGAWRPYLAGGRSLVTVPVTSIFWMDGQRMATATGTALRLAGGYFLASDPHTGRIRASSPPTWTSRYFGQTIAAGQPPPAQPGDADRLIGDLRYWRAGALVLLPQQVHAAALRAGVARLLGPPVPTGGVLLWDVRALTADGS